MYLLVRELTTQPAAAFLAASRSLYTPYRLGQFSHLQVLRSYWMPLVLLGLHRYFVGHAAARRDGPDAAGRRPRAWRPLAGAAGALVLQNLSCGYFMLFFAPFVAAYAAYEMVQRRLLGASACGDSSRWPPPPSCCSPGRSCGHTSRSATRRTSACASREEIRMFSADAHAFGTIAPNSRLLADRLSGYPNAEGEGFSGFTILLFAAVGTVWGLGRILRGVPWRTLPEWHVLGLAASGLLLAGGLGVMALVLRARPPDAHAVQ